MDALRQLIAQYLRAAWRRRWIGVIFAWLVCGLGWVGVYAIPNQYESSARLFVDADAVLTPLLRGIAADSAPTTQLEILQRTLLSRPNLEKLISKTDLDLSLNGPSDRERTLTRLILLCHFLIHCLGLLQAARTPGQRFDQPDGELTADRGNRVRHMPLRPHRQPLVVGSLRVTQVFRSACG